MMQSENKVPELSVIQKWMQSVISHPSGIESGIQSDGSQEQISLLPEQIEQVITRSEACTSIERLQVYGNAYFARLLDCLRSFFPALTKTLGEELFDSFSIEYLQKYPSSSYTLHKLADQYVEFLTSTKPVNAGSNEPVWEDFLIELATFEWTIDQVFDGPGHEKMSILDPEQLASIEPDQWAGAWLETSPSLILLSFEFPINDFFTKYRQNEELIPPSPQKSYLALTRRNYVVRRIPQTHLQFELLLRLQAGDTVGQAIGHIADLTDEWETLSGHLQGWFRQFAEEEFFMKVHLSD